MAEHGLTHPDILVIEDEPSIAEALLHSLAAEKFSARWCSLGSEALKDINRKQPDLIILDVGLPDCSGFDLCRDIKAINDIPIIFLTARQEEIDKLIGLEIGGEDYITKPFSLRELISRVKVVLRRYQKTSQRQSEEKQEKTGHLQLGPLTLDDDRKQVLYYQQPIELTPYEYGILNVLAQQPNRVFSREQLMDQVWSEPDRSFDRAVDTQIKALRKKLLAISSDQKIIKTHHGLGYSLTLDPSV